MIDFIGSEMHVHIASNFQGGGEGGGIAMLPKPSWFYMATFLWTVTTHVDAGLNQVGASFKDGSFLFFWGGGT